MFQRQASAAILLLLLVSCSGQSAGNSLNLETVANEPGRFVLVRDGGQGDCSLQLEQASTGKVIEIVIQIADASNVSSVLAHLEYDASVYSPSAVRFDGFLGDRDEVISMSVTDIAGTVPLGEVQIPSSGIRPATGSGRFATVIFERKPATSLRRISASPAGSHNTVTDLKILSQTAETATLEWTERNTGDYNNDSEVGLADLVPVSLLFNQQVATAENAVWAAMVDGDGNGEINLADITPIAANFGSTCDGYVLYTDAAALSPYAPGIVADRSVFYQDKQTPVVYSLEAGFSLDGSTVFTVRPVSAQDLTNPGPASNQVSPETAGPLVFNPPGRAFTGTIAVELTGVEPENIRFTTDNSPPDISSQIYTGALELQETTWLRAAIFIDNQLNGKITSQAYLAVDESVAEFTSNLPLILIDTFGFDIDSESSSSAPRPFRPVLTEFIDVGGSSRASILGETDYGGYGAMHVRGSSSSGFAKKQYRYEARRDDERDLDVELFDMPAESDWVIQGPYSDKTLMRNELIFDWSNRIGRYAPRVVFAEALINMDGGTITADDYAGVYLLMENIKRGPYRVNIARLDATMNSEPEISGGYILKQDRLDDDEVDIHTDVYGSRLIFVYPAAEDITEIQIDWIDDYIGEFEEVLDGPDFDDPADGYAKYIDVLSFIDQLLLTEMARNVDGYRLSTYMYKDRGGKLTMGPAWDYNLALGNADYFHAFEIEGWQFSIPEYLESEPAFLAWYYRLLEDPAFVQQVKDRWQELRSGVLSTNSMMADIEENVTLLGEAQERNFMRWNVQGHYVWPNVFVGDTYREDVDFMKGWLTDRLNWMDSQLQ